MRISGIVLVFLVLIHLYMMHLVDEGVERVDFAFVAERWDNVGWKTFDWVMLFLALLHGANGLRIIIDDYVQSRRTADRRQGHPLHGHRRPDDHGHCGHRDLRPAIGGR